MISQAEAEFLAPAVIGLVEDAVKAAAPAVADIVDQFVPTIEKVAALLISDDQTAIRAELLSMQKDAIDAAVNAQLAAIKT